MLREDGKFLVKLAIATVTTTGLLILAYEKFAVLASIVSAGLPAISLMASLGVLLNVVVFGSIAARSGDVLGQGVFGGISVLMILQIAFFQMGIGGDFALVISFISTMVLAASGAHFVKSGEDPERATSHLIGAVCSTLMIAITGV